MEITNVRICIIANNTRLKGLATIVISDCFVVNELRIIEGREGLFVAMPSRRLKDGSYKDIAHPINTETRRLVEDAVLSKFREMQAAENE